MPLEYTILYTAENEYDEWVNEAQWQFLIIPEQNSSQSYMTMEFSNSLNAPNEFSINGYGFRTIRVHPRHKFKSISFEASFKLIKNEVNPFDFNPLEDSSLEWKKISDIGFQVDFEPFLRPTRFTIIPESHPGYYEFTKELSLFDNLQALNNWTYQHIYFKAGVTDVHTSLEEVMEKRQGVCQDFTHLFCAVARKNGIPARYVSGYLHQGNGYFGDSQMHAWAESFVPGIGWIGFDPTNDILASTNHIKVAHGKDYTDCSPLKGVVYAKGSNETRHAVQVSAQQQ